MSRFDQTAPPPPLPSEHFDVAARLERLGIAVWHQGDGLIRDLMKPSENPRPDPSDPRPTRVFLCAAAADALLQSLPNAVVTAPDRRRMMLGTTSGPIDLLPMASLAVEDVLGRFGLSAFSFAWRPIRACWCDPTGNRQALAAGHLDLALEAPNPFRAAPRRYWIAARLLAEYDLEATPRLIEAARTNLTKYPADVPEGASARREMQRILAGRGVRQGLRFLHDVGLCQTLFPGMNVSGAEIVGDLEPDPTLRWAAWIAGASTQRALRRLRMPPRRARAIERLLRYHPIDRTTHSTSDAGIQRLRQKLTANEIEGLIAWRRFEIDRAETSTQSQADLARLSDLELRLERLTTREHESFQIKRLAIDGKSVMEILESRPGKRVGRALAHLAAFIRNRPASNELESLEVELRDWANRNPE